jgi:hypothetical protein
MFGRPFVTQFESAEVSEPTECSFDDVAGSAEAAAVLALRIAVGRQLWPDAALHDLPDDGRTAVGRVPLKDLRFTARSSASACHSRQLVQHGNRAFSIRLIGRASLDDQRHTLGVGDYMPFATFFRAIGGIGAGMVPPKTARIEALSMTARESRIAPRFPKRRNSRRCSWGQTLSCVHSCNRRQHVTPLPQPISKGSRFQDKPLLRTKMIPARQARFETGGRPPLGDGLCWGSNGSTSLHSLFETNAAIVRLLAEQEGGILAINVRF